MRRAHFQRWQPTCLSCRASGRVANVLELSRVLREEQDDVLEGILLCPDVLCQREYPIIDGIPILVLDPARFIESQLAEIRAREDLSPTMETVLGDCAGADSSFESERYHLSLYGRGHWGDMDPERPDPREGALSSVIERAFELASGPPAQPTGSWIDIGCSVGRATFELAARTDALTLGVDLNFSMLRMARRTMRSGRVSYPLRRSGLVYDRCDYGVETVTAAAADKVDFWASDATGLALASDSFSGALSLNLLDCVPSPLGHLLEMGRVLEPGSPALICTPYDWSNSTPAGGWLGGHSQRSDHQGSSVVALRRVLSDEASGEHAPALRITAEADDVAWRVRVHERAEMLYRAHMVAARAI